MAAALLVRIPPAGRILLLLVAYLALASAPLALAATRDLPRRPWMDELSSGLAMTAFAALLLEFLLSGRYRALSAGIGMDITMRFHQAMAVIATTLLLVHPALYRLPYAAPLPWDPARALSVYQTPAATVTGLAAWLLLAIVVALALARARLSISYEAWRISHGLGALAIAALGAHHVLASGRYAQDPWLRTFWLAALALVGVSLAVSWVVRPILQRRRPLRVAAVRPVAERLWQVELEPDGGQPAFGFAAGQFVWLRFNRAFGRITEHPFSIASAPSALPHLSFLVRECGDFTGAIGRLPVGTPAFVDGPYGNLTLAGRQAERIVLIAGGAGIAPLLSIARELTARDDPRPVVLVYADRRLEQLAARAELEAIARRGRLELHYLLQEPPAGWDGLTGIPDERALARVVPAQAPAAPLYLVCGPPGMIDRVELALARLGVPLSRIVSERFRYATGVVTPRERGARAVVALVAAVLIAVSLLFSLG